MDFLNAIAKVRFASARAQRVHLGKVARAQAEMLCMEPGQRITVRAGQWVYYVLSGEATMTASGETTDLAAGHVAASEMDEQHTLSAAGEHRLLCLAFGQDT